MSYCTRPKYFTRNGGVEGEGRASWCFFTEDLTRAKPFLCKMGDESEKRFQAVMDKLFQATPNPKPNTGDTRYRSLCILFYL